MAATGQQQQQGGLPPHDPLPQGWLATWNEQYQRYVYTDTNAGENHWAVPPTAWQQQQSSSSSYDQHQQQQQHQPGHGQNRQSVSEQPNGIGGGQQQANAKGKRRYADSDQYYAGQQQSDTQFAQPGYGQPAGIQQQQQQPNNAMFQPAQAPQFYNPTGNQQQQQQQVPGPAPYVDGNRGDMYQQGPYQQQQPQMAQMTQQMGQMQMNSAYGQQQQAQQPLQRPQINVQTVNLIGLPTNPADIHAPPPEIRLPPDASFSQHPARIADPTFQRCTLNAIPINQSLLNKSKIPFALVTTPYRSVRPGDAEIPVVSDYVIARCRRCRTYINPFVSFIEGGNRWKCCMCNLSNEVPQLFDWNQAENKPANRWERAELNHSVVDFVAPTEYMVRPPQPPVYVFLIDVSYNAIHSGMVATAARTILESLDRFPNKDGLAKICIVGVDTALYFFQLAPGSTEPSMMVVGDIDDVFLPSPSDLLVNLTEHREGIENLLSRFNDMFKDTHITGSALGSALQAGYKMIQNVGGKITVLSSTLPSHGPGVLKARDEAKYLGTQKESSFLQPQGDFYKRLATDCSRQQVSVDMWLFSSTYTDVATLSCLPRYTGGQTFFYPAFDASRSEDALKFAHEFSEHVTQPFMLEAVLRVRANRGLRMTSYHGNAFVRSTDLLALSTVSRDQNYAVEIQIEDPLTTPFVVLQTAILHTSSFGERMIRVVTTAYPTTSNMAEIFASVDQVALADLLANKAVERSLSHKMEDARDAIVNKLVDILTVYKQTMTSSGPGASPQLVTSDNMKNLPVLCLGLLKHVGLRKSAQIPSDLRSYAQALLTTLPAHSLVSYIYPSFYSLHNMPRECGTVGDNGVILPPALPLTSERLERHGLHLIDDGQNMFLWVGRDAVPQLIGDVFDLASSAELKSGKATLPTLDNPFSERVNAIIGKLRESKRGVYYPSLFIVKEDGEQSLRMWALSALIEDRQDSAPSYNQFLGTLKDKVNGS